MPASDMPPNSSDAETLVVLKRIATALEQLAPQAPTSPNFDAADAFIWQPATAEFQPVPEVSRVDLTLLVGINRARDTLLHNTERFAQGLPANNALLWGARGMGKSSLVKAVHAKVSQSHTANLKLVEVHREDIDSLPIAMTHMRQSPARFIVFCDDLSFDHDDTSYKSLKAALDGGIEGRPSNVVFYATSNRRHLLPRDMMENEKATSINPGDAVEEKVSLSDRFGLWLGFHSGSQDQFFTMVENYIDYFGLAQTLGEQNIDWRAEAHQWAMGRGNNSGRVAWQFIQDLAGRAGVPLAYSGGKSPASS